MGFNSGFKGLTAGGFIVKCKSIFCFVFNMCSPDKGKKVKVTLVQALRLCTGRTAHRGSRVIALLFHDHGTRREWGVSVTPLPLFTFGKDSVPIVQEAGWAPGPVWTGTEYLAPTGIRSPDLPVRNQPLYRLSYRAHNIKGLDWQKQRRQTRQTTLYMWDTPVAHPVI